MSPKARCSSVVFALISSLFAADALAAGLPLEIDAPDGQAGNRFGYSVALSASSALIGAPGDDAGGELSGSAYVFVTSGGSWSLQAKLAASDAAAMASFGQAVSIAGDTAVVGAPYATTAGTAAGAVYVFTRSGSVWTQQAKLSAPDYGVYDYFGSALSLSGDTLAVGAPYADVFGADSGAAYVFKRSATTWSVGTKLFPADSRSDDLFGSSVSLSGLRLAVGAPNDDDNAVASGSVYVFNASGSIWSAPQKLRPTDGANGDLFGNAIALAGSDLIVGAPENDAVGAAAGAAYFYSSATGSWSLQQKLVASDAANGDFFGAAVAISRERILIGALLDDASATDTGAAYLFTRNGTWSQSSRLQAPSPAADDNFAAAIAIDGERVLIGVEQDDPSGAESGSCFSIDLETVVNATPVLGLARFGLASLLGVLGFCVLRRQRLLLRNGSTNATLESPKS